MLRIALKMLFGDGARFAGILFGLVLTAFLITQQSSIFWGLMSRTFGAITDLGGPDIWVMDPKVQFVDDIKPLPDTELNRVRSIPGVAWAVPLYKGLIKARLENGNFQTCNVLGLDDASLTGGPPVMAEGRLEDLRHADGVIIDDVGATGKLAKPASAAGGKPIPLKIGDTLELNDHCAIVVGICRVSRTFQSNPVVYTTYSRATSFAPRERKLLSFVLVEVKPGHAPAQVCADIQATTGMLAHTHEGFAMGTFWYFMKYTGIPINFGIAVVLAFLVGAAISGLMFHGFTLDNLRHFAAFKAMGASNSRLLGMVVLQALTVGLLGYGIGIGAASGFGLMTGSTELAFRMTWLILGISAVAVVAICVLAALAALWKVVRVDPALVFKG